MIALQQVRQTYVRALHRGSIRTFFNLPPFPGGSEQKHRVKHRINVSPQEMFEVVSNVDKYTEFVPFCEKSFVNARDKETNLPTEAGLKVGWRNFEEKFTCKLVCLKPHKVIAESITILLFNKLYTEWTIKEVKTFNVSNESSCEIELNLVYDFKNPVYNAVSSMFSEQVSKIMLKAFEERAMRLKIANKIKR